MIPSSRKSRPARLSGMVTPTTLPCGSVIELAEMDMPSITKGAFNGDFVEARFIVNKHGARKMIPIKNNLRKIVCLIIGKNIQFDAS
jgi:hypothetical protein